VLCDTTVLVDVLRGDDVAAGWLRSTRQERGRLAISAVTVTEITGGMRSHERSRVHGLLGSFEVVAVDELVAHKGGELARRFRRSHPGLGTADLLIAATAAVHLLELATANVRHFPMFPDLVPPY
jgi:hypothetical protein